MRQSVHNSLEFTKDDLPREMTQPEVVAAKVCEMFDGQNPVKIADVARALEMNYGTCKTHIHRAAQMNLLTLVKRKGFLPGNGPRRKINWVKKKAEIADRWALVWIDVVEKEERYNDGSNRGDAK